MFYVRSGAWTWSYAPSSRWPGICLDTKESYRMHVSCMTFYTSPLVLQLILPGFLLHWSLQNALDTNAIFCGQQSKFRQSEIRPKRSKQRAEVVLFPAQMISSEFLIALNGKIKIIWGMNSPKPLGPHSPFCNIPVWPGAFRDAQVGNAYLVRAVETWELTDVSNTVNIVQSTKLCPTLCDSMRYWHLSRF